MLVLLSEEVLGYNTQAVLQVHLIMVLTTAQDLAALLVKVVLVLQVMDLAVLYL
jgi:hypothetical protein